MEVQQLSNVPYIGAPHSDWYIEYDQKEKTIKMDEEIITSSKVVFDIISDIKEQLTCAPESGHHYDVFRYGDVIRIGMQGHNISISKGDIPRL